jgi:hypothetical protein
MKQLLTERDFRDAARFLGCEVAAVKAVAEVEAPRGGFCPDGFPVTLFEGHIFFRYTKGRFAESHPRLCYPKWTTEFYGRSWVAERERLDAAIALDRRAALMSASWGRFQIMGFNFPVVGCASVQQFVNRMCESERRQGELFVQYIIHEGLADELRDRRWDDFARFYNGPLYKKNRYAERLEKAYRKFCELEVVNP